ncbi:MAG: tRNA (guanosine(37)-N1)-methyltransferase TrmD [Chloroflexi bacterium]|nr:tRNA (guanosine(37)-N1)-methyltransferase TrmD [Chloroflexota bacterium]
MKIDALSLFPAMFDSVMNASMMWKAQDRGLLTFRAHDIRDYAADKHRQVDEPPYGGGGGMILKPDVLVRAIEALRPSAETPVILLSPQGKLLTHQVAVELAQLPQLVLVCGHYEGVDERVRQLAITDEISIGDYVLTGGELAALVLIDAVVRLIPGVLGAEGATDRDSHADGLLEGAHYTRPHEYRGLTVPAILTSGHHAEVARWRRRQALLRTWQRRPDLLESAQLTTADREWLEELAGRQTPLAPSDRSG